MNYEIGAQLSRAVTERFVARTGVFLSDAGQNQFTGIFFRSFDGSLYIFTAAHCIRDITDFESVLLATYRKPSPGILVDLSGYTLHSELDLAVIALDKDIADSLDVDWFEKDDISSNGAFEGEIACAYGFPSQFFEVHEGTPRVAQPTPHIYLTEVSLRSPQAQLTRPASEEIDFFIEKEQGNTLGEGGELLPPYSPRGMSGCGVYTVPRPKVSEIWSPSDARLAGILCSVIESEGLIRCIRVEHVLSLCGYKVSAAEGSLDR